MRIARKFIFILGGTAAGLTLFAFLIFLWRLLVILEDANAESRLIQEQRLRTHAHYSALLESRRLNSYFELLENRLRHVARVYKAASGQELRGHGEVVIADVLADGKLDALFVMYMEPEWDEPVTDGYLRGLKGGRIRAELSDYVDGVSFSDLLTELRSGAGLRLFPARRPDGVEIVLLLRPVRGENGRLMGVLVGGMRRESLNSLLALDLDSCSGSGAMLALRRGDGLVLAQRFDQSGEDLDFLKSRYRWTEQLEGTRDIPTVRLYRDGGAYVSDAYLIAYAPITVLASDSGGWFVELGFFYPSELFGNLLPGVGEQHIHRILRLAVTVLIPVLALYLLVLFIFARDISSPLRRAVSFSNYLAKGDFSIKLKSSRKDELGDLIKSLNHMKNRLQNSIVRLKASHERERDARHDLQEADRLRSDFLAQMSSELKTPLNSIIAAGNLLRDELGGKLSPAWKEKVEELNRNSENLYELISNLLELSKLESSRIELRLSEIETSSFMRELLDFHHLSAESKDISLACEYPAELPAIINTDRNLLFHSLSSLITNVVSLAHCGATVTVGCRTTAHELIFTVCGAPSSGKHKTLADIYNQYTHLDPDLMPYFGGHAVLRMAIAKANASLLRAELLAETMPDGASLFSLTFRKSDVVFYAATETSSIHIASNWMKKLNELTEEEEGERNREQRRVRILVADADTRARSRVEQILRDAEIEFDSVGNGKDCLEALHERSYDFLLLDFAIPRVSALRLVGKLRKEPFFANLPIVVIANHLEADERDKLQRVGVNDFLLKPVEVEDLLRSINALVE